MDKTKIYLDYASASPVDKQVKQAMLPFYDNIFFNASGLYSGGLQAKQSLTIARQTIARAIGARPTEVIFTSGGSESNNLAIQGVMDSFKSANLLVSAVEHDSILEPAKLYDYTTIQVNKNGQVELDNLSKKINDSTVLISVQLANNEIGTIQPIKQIAQFITEVRKKRLKTGNELPIYLHCDACQAVNYLDINTARLGVDLMSVNGGKIYGPKGAGFLFIKAGTKIRPLIYGGGQEFNIRSGTENLAGVVGLSTALDITQQLRANETKRLTDLTEFFYQNLSKKLTNISINGPKNNRLPNNLNIEFDGVDNERLIMRLDMMGVACSAGSACGASSAKPSHVLNAIGLSDKQARSSVRFSLGRQTTQKDIETAIRKIVQARVLEQ